MAGPDWAGPDARVGHDQRREREGDPLKIRIEHSKVRRHGVDHLCGWTGDDLQPVDVRSAQKLLPPCQHVDGHALRARERTDRGSPDFVDEELGADGVRPDEDSVAAGNSGRYSGIRKQLDVDAGRRQPRGEPDPFPPGSGLGAAHGEVRPARHGEERRFNGTAARARDQSNGAASRRRFRAKQQHL